MKKLSVFVALALLAASGTGFAATCVYDNVPGASLLVPYFRVSGTVDSSGLIGPGGTDTKVSFVNVSWPGIIAHVTVWNKYSKAVLDFNVPMTGKDVVSMNMRDVLNGQLNVNPLTQVKPTKDVCGIDLSTGKYNAAPFVGWGQTSYLRFPHPQSGNSGELDWQVSISKYATPDAFAGFRAQVMTSLDESGDIKSFQKASVGPILDVDNSACQVGAGGLGDITGEFSGYLTIDVVNFCTNWFPNQAEFYENDAIATAGWQPYGYTPNVLIGDVFYVDPTANSGNISGDQAVALEFGQWLDTGYYGSYSLANTFFSRFVYDTADSCELNGGTVSPCGAQTFTPGVPPQFWFGGDGREPLGEHYGFRYLSSADFGLRSWILVWRGDYVLNPGSDSPNNDYFTPDLCDWLAAGGPKGYGFYDTNHQLTFQTWDYDEGNYSVPTQGNPSGYQPPPPPKNYVFLEANRIDLFQNTQIIPGYTTAGAFNGGWIDVLFRNDTAYTWPDSFFNQAWVGVQHTGPGTLLNVGHSAPLFQTGSFFNGSFYTEDWLCTWVTGGLPQAGKAHHKSVK